jgi:hypothetical protein
MSTKITHNAGGPPPGNQNATRHGLRGIGWPPGTANDRRAVWALKRAAGAAVVANGGQLDLLTCSLLETLGDHERHRRLAARWLRESPGLTVDQKLTLSRDVAKASSDRDKTLRALGLDARPRDLWAAIDGGWQPTEATP